MGWNWTNKYFTLYNLKPIKKKIKEIKNYTLKPYIVWWYLILSYDTNLVLTTKSKHNKLVNSYIPTHNSYI